MERYKKQMRLMQPFGTKKTESYANDDDGGVSQEQICAYMKVSSREDIRVR
jgi:hypothetical protein